MAEETVRQSEAALRDAEANRARRQVSNQDVENAESAVRQAEAALEAARAALDQKDWNEEDIRAAAAALAQARATIMKEPFDVMEVGRMSVIQDPTGAVFAIWQAGTHSGAGIYNVPNSLCWNELATPDTAKAGEFYTSLFGWGKDVKEMGPMTYTSFINGDRPAGGMYKPTPEMGDIPPNWLAYFAVDDTDAKVAKAKELGATIFVPPMDIPEVGRFAVIQDPQGAFFGIIKLNQPPPA
jgi:hypothetical protein